MSLQRRLTLFFIIIVMLPLLAAGLVVRYVLVGEVEERAEMSLRPALDSTLVGYNLRVASIDEIVIASVAPGVNRGMNLGRLLQQGRASELARKLEARLDGGSALDFIAVLDQRNRPIAFERGREPEFASGFDVSDGRIVRAARMGGRNEPILFGDGFVTTAAFEVEDGSGSPLGLSLIHISEPTRPY